MYIEFSYIDGLELPIDKKLKLVEGLLLLERQNKECIKSGEMGSVNYQLYFSEEDEIDVFGGMLDFPMATFNFPLLVEQELTADGAKLTPEIEEFLTSLYKAVQQKRPRKKRKVSASKPRSELPMVHEPTRDPEEEIPVSDTANDVQLPKKPRKKIRISKKAGIVVSVFFLCLLLSVLGLKFVPPLLAEQTPSFETLLKDGKYLEAGKTFPSQQEDIEQTLYEQALETQNTQAKKELALFQSKYPTTFGEFDLAILNKNYEEALQLYKKSEKEFNKDNDRMTLVGYCYLKKDLPKEAKEISIDTKSVELEKYVYQYEQYMAQINEYEKQLTELKKDPVKNRDAIEKTLNDLFDIKEELVNL